MKTIVQQNGNKIIIEIADDIPDYVFSDYLRIRQIIINLVANSNKFTKDGEIFIKIEKPNIEEI